MTGPPFPPRWMRCQRARIAHENLMPAILAAVEAEATVGEISDALRDAFGVYEERVVL